MVVLQMTLTMLISPIVYMVSLQPRHISTHITLKETVLLWSLQLLVSGELYYFKVKKKGSLIKFRLLETTHSALSVHLMYRYTVSDFGSLEEVGMILW